MKLEKLDALRGFAALYVVVHHAMPRGTMLGHLDVSGLFRLGQEAVILFFLLSGFVVNFSHVRGRDKSFQTYIIKRGLRIYVPLIAVFLLGWGVQSLRSGATQPVNLTDLLLNLLMLQDAGSLKPGVIVEPFMGNSPLWSLSYEWWFYMLYFPLQRIQCVQKRNRLVQAAALAAAIVYAISPSFVSRLLMYLSIWWCGVVLSDVYLSGRRFTFSDIRNSFLTLMLICAVQAWMVFRAWKDGSYSSIGVHPALELRHHAAAVAALVIALAWHSRAWIGFDFFFHPFSRVAPISYVLYISHYYFLVPPLTGGGIGLVLGAALLWIFSYFVELVFYPKVQRWVMSRRMVRFDSPQATTS